MTTLVDKECYLFSSTSNLQRYPVPRRAIGFAAAHGVVCRGDRTTLLVWTPHKKLLSVKDFECTSSTTCTSHCSARLHWILWSSPKTIQLWLLRGDIVKIGYCCMRPNGYFGRIVEWSGWSAPIICTPQIIKQMSAFIWRYIPALVKSTRTLLGDLTSFSSPPDAIRAYSFPDSDIEQI